MKDSRGNSADDATQQSPRLTQQEQSDRLAELMLASARRLATDPQRLGGN